MYNINSLKIDICYLVNAYNLVGGSISSFFQQIILLNNNIKIIWEYAFKRLSTSNINNILFRWIKRRNIKKYIMYSSNAYYEKMYPWTNNQSQRDLMINDNCTNFFIVT